MSAAYCISALRDIPWSCSFARLVEATIARRRSRGSATSVASDARIAPTSLPPPVSPLGRMFTGTIAVMASRGSASCSRRKRRSAAAVSARTPSLSVPPSARAMRLRRSTSNRCVAKRRLRLIFWLSTDRGAWSGVTSGLSFDRADRTRFIAARPTSREAPTWSRRRCIRWSSVGSAGPASSRFARSWGARANQAACRAPRDRARGSA